ncbi:MAG TPA: hypothetical protein VKG25_00020 [Bryobacteraceae bacterium]|nr:hypothetical protein [Bryobacteraceae bacterium]
MVPPGLLAAIFSLEEFPERCPIIPEAVDHGAQEVLVYRIYHGARKTIGPEDIGS